MPENRLAVIVPVDISSQDRESLRQEVWETVISLLLPGLGTYYRTFYPENLTLEHKSAEPFDIIFGEASPEEFLLFYIEACCAQASAIEYHTEAIMNTADLEHTRQKTDDDTLICPAVADSSNQERIAHATWYLAIHEGALLPDCGVYYAGLHRGIISRDEQKEILENLAEYALCMVTLEEQDD